MVKVASKTRLIDGLSFPVVLVYKFELVQSMLPPTYMASIFESTSSSLLTDMLNNILIWHLSIILVLTKWPCKYPYYCSLSIDFRKP